MAVVITCMICIVSIVVFITKLQCDLFDLRDTAVVLCVRLSEGHDVIRFAAGAGGLPCILQLKKVMCLPSSA